MFITHLCKNVLYRIVPEISLKVLKSAIVKCSLDASVYT